MMISLNTAKLLAVDVMSSRPTVFNLREYDLLVWCCPWWSPSCRNGALHSADTVTHRLLQLVHSVTVIYYST